MDGLSCNSTCKNISEISADRTYRCPTKTCQHINQVSLKLWSRPYGVIQALSIMLRRSIKEHAHFCRNSVFFDQWKVGQKPLFFNFSLRYLTNVVLFLVDLKDLVVGFHDLWAVSLEGLLLAFESHESYVVIVSELWFAFFPGDFNFASPIPDLQCLRYMSNCRSFFCCHPFRLVHDPQGFKFPKCSQNVIRWRWLVDVTAAVGACEVGMCVAPKVFQCRTKAHSAQICQTRNGVIWLVTASFLQKMKDCMITANHDVNLMLS